MSKKLKEWFTTAMQRMYILPKIVSTEDIDQFSEHDISVGSYSLHYAQAGKGDTLLFIHGMSNNWIGWVPLTKIMKNYYHVVMLDLPGYGGSDRLAAYNVETEAEAIAKFIKTTGIKPKAIIGLSMGSIVIGQFLARYSDLVGRAVLCGPMFQVRDAAWMSKASSVGFTMLDKTKGAGYALKRFLTTTAVSYVITKYLNMYKFNRELVDAYGLKGRRLMDQKAFIQMGISVSQNDLEEDLDGVDVPVMIIYGEEDKISSIEDAKVKLEEKHGNFTFKSIPQAGHIVTLEKPQQVSDLIREFLQD